MLITILPRIIVFGTGLAIGSSVALAAYENGLGFAPGLLGSAFGAGFAGATIACWFLPSIAMNTGRGLGVFLLAVWLPGTVFVIANAVRFTAAHLDESVGGKADRMTTYDLAAQDLPRLEAELATAQSNERWAKTTGCTDVTAEKSVAYCHGVRAIESRLAEVRRSIAGGRPKSADPGGERLAAVFRMSRSNVDVFWPVFQAAILDILASACMTAAFAPVRAKPRPRTSAVPLLEAPGWLSNRPMSPRLPRLAGPFRFNMDKRSLRLDHLQRRTANDTVH